MTLHLGTRAADSTVYIPFDSFDGGDGSSITMTGLAVTDIEIYKNGSVTQRASDNGYTLLDTDGIDFDGVTGLHGFSLDLSDDTDSGFYSIGGFYMVAVSSITIDGQTVNFWVATFDIGPAFGVTGYPVVDVGAVSGDGTAADNLELACDNYSATRGLAGTALPAAAADAAGGVPVSDAGGLDMDAIPTAAEINAQVDTALSDINLDHLLSAAESTDVATNSVIGKLASADGDWSNFAGSDHALQALRERGDAAWTTGGGTGLTALGSGTAQSGTASTIVLASAAAFADNVLNGNVIKIHTGTGAGQARVITSNTLADDTCNVTPNWTTNPSSDSQYEIVEGAANVVAMLLDAQSVTDLKDFADAGYDPATNKVQGVVLVDTTTTNSDMVGTDSAALASVCTEARLSELDAGTAGKAAHQVDEIRTDTEDLQSRTPAALVGGRVDANVGAISADATAADNLESYCDGTTPIPANVTQVHDDAAAAANLESACDNYSAERGLAGTALPAAAADAAGGIPISDAGALDLDAISSAVVGTLSEITGAADIPATPTLKQACMLLYMYVRNAGQATSAERRVMNDAGTEVLDAPMSDNGTIFDQGELGAP